MNTNVVTITDLPQPVRNLGSAGSEFLRLVRERLANEDFRLPVLDSSPDAYIIRQLNETLNNDQIRSIMECVVVQQFNKDVILMMLKAIPVDFLKEFLDLRGIANVANFNNFLNFLVYMSVGVGDFVTTQALINEMIIDLISVVADSGINTESLISTSQELQEENEVANNSRNLSFSTRMSGI